MNQTKTNVSTVHVAQFLTTKDSKTVFKNATDAFMTYKVKYDENQKYLDQAREFYNAIVF